MNNGNHNRYIDEFLQLRSAPLFLELKLFPNAKEITETFGIFNALRICMKKYGFSYSDHRTVVVVGDGHTPRTAATIACRTGWSCHSVDPELNDRLKYKRVLRLHCHKEKIQDFRILSVTPAILILPHSHVTIEECLKSVNALETIIVTMDCCMDTWENLTPELSYQDSSIWSEKNEIRIKRIRKD